jgi:hypothetical protein
MWLQTTIGTFGIARLPGDAEQGMMHLLSTTYDDILLLSDQYLGGIDSASIDMGPFRYAIRLLEGRVISLFGQLMAEVWYQELPQAVETLFGHLSGPAYWNAYKEIDRIKPIHQDASLPCNAKEEIILESGVEGGSVSIGMKEENGQRRYTVNMYDCTMSFLNDEDRIGPDVVEEREDFFSWADAIQYLDRHPWWNFYPILVAREYRELVRHELRNRGVDPSASEWARLLNEDKSDGAWKK